MTQQQQGVPKTHRFDFLAEWFNSRWHPRMGAIDGRDVAFLAALLERYKPRQIVEVGCASGLSTSVLAMLQQKIGPATLSSFDVAHHFYVDPEKPLGYLLDEALPHPDVQVTLFPGCTSQDVGDKIAAPIDLCFTDAMHKHPWPLADMLAVLPLMKPGGIIVHHDLQMFQGSDLYATGPKVAMDQVPRDLLLRADDMIGARAHGPLATRHIKDNIYALRVPEDIRAFAETLSRGFCIGWDVDDPGKWLPQAYSARLRGIIETHYSAETLRHFDLGLARYRPADPVPPAPASLPRRAWRKLRRTLAV